MCDENRDYPRGGFVANAVCPFCGEEIGVNIPATPESGENRVFQNCKYCHNEIVVFRTSYGDWRINKWT